MIRPGAMERLRWLVLREFRVLPGSEAALQASDEDIIFAGVNMVLDMESGGDPGENPAFSEERFRQMKERERTCR